MKSVKLQLLVTLAAVLTAAALFAVKGLPPSASLLKAAQNSDVTQVRRNLNWGVDVNTRDSEGVTPLHWAAYFNSEGVAELLITYGADVNAKMNNGGTPLQLAALFAHKDVADLLRQHGAKE
jgi:ankyrin repeat protein